MIPSVPATALISRGRALRRQFVLRALTFRPARRMRARGCRGRAARPGLTTLVVANPYGRVENLPELASFFSNVERLGAGRVRIAFVNGWASRNDRDEERTVLEDLARGIADLGWVGARAIGTVFGIRSLEPLLAPLSFLAKRPRGGLWPLLPWDRCSNRYGPPGSKVLRYCPAGCDGRLASQVPTRA